MRQMTGRHQKIAIANPRPPPRLAAPMYRHMLADHIFFAQYHTALGSGIKSQVLGLSSYDRRTSDPCPLPHHHMTNDLRMRLDLAPSTNFGSAVDHHIRADFSRGVNFRSWVD